jgi:UDP-glucose 6-dehydrogenase
MPPVSACQLTMNSPSTPMAVVGAGYVGLVTAVGLAQVRPVRLVDRDSVVLDSLAKGEMPISEPGLETRFECVKEEIMLHQRLEDALDDEAAKMVFIAVDTPTQRDASSAIAARADADAVVLATAWPEFQDIDWEDAAAAMSGKLVVDGRNALSPDVIRAAGLEYEGTGRESRGLDLSLVEGVIE